MGSVVFEICQLGFIRNRNYSRRCSGLQICCGLRNGKRKGMWRSRVLSTEAIQAVHSLKLAKSPARIQQVFHGTLSRLLKADLLDTLAELNRQNHVDLALKVFEFLRKEVWYKPDTSLFSDMILMLGKNKLICEAEELFSQLKKEGLEPDTRAYTELIGAYVQVDMLNKAIETYHFMKASGCVPDKLTLIILIRNLQLTGKGELAAQLKKECYTYLDSPKKFLKEAETTFPKRRSLNVF